MSKWIYSFNPGSALVNGQGATNYLPISGLDVLEPTESVVQALARASFTASNLWVVVDAVTGTLTVRFRKNSANGNQVISATTTGSKEDTTNTDSVVSGDVINFRATTSNSHTNTATFKNPSVLLDDAGVGRSLQLASTNSGAEWTASAVFCPIHGLANTTITEAECRAVWREAATFSNLRTNMASNSFAAATTYRTRKNGANGGQVVSYNASETGVKEDASGTDSVAAGDTVNFGKDSGGTSGNGYISVIETTSSASAFNPLNTSVDYGSLGASVTQFHGLGGGSRNTTESNVQVKARVADTFKNMQTNVTANTRSDATTVDFRANAASPGGGPSISVAASETGIKEDLSGTYTTATTDTINYRVVTGGGTGTITLTTVGAQQGAAAAVQDAPELRGRPFGLGGARQMTQLIAQ